MLDKAKLAYEEAVRVIEEQDKARTAYRSAATTILTVATIATSLFGFTELEPTPLFWIGLAGLGVVTASVIYLYSPRDWVGNPGRMAVARFVEDDDQWPAFMYANLALSHQENFVTNSVETNKMARATLVLLLGLLVMLAAWTSNAVLANPSADHIQKVQLVEVEN